MIIDFSFWIKITEPGLMRAQPKNQVYYLIFFVEYKVLSLFGLGFGLSLRGGENAFLFQGANGGGANIAFDFFTIND